MSPSRKEICKSGNGGCIRTVGLCGSCQKFLQRYFITFSLIKQINLLFQMPTSAPCQTRGWKVKKCHPSAACISCPTSDIWKAWMSQMTEFFMLRWRFWGVGRLSLSEWLVSFMEKLTEVEMLWTAMPYWGKRWEGMDTILSKSNERWFSVQPPLPQVHWGVTFSWWQMLGSVGQVLSSQALWTPASEYRKL